MCRQSPVVEPRCRAHALPRDVSGDRRGNRSGRVDDDDALAEAMYADTVLLNFRHLQYPREVGLGSGA